MKQTSSLLQALGSGLAGALVLNILHETVRHIRPDDAPRMDVLGKRGLRKLLRKADAPQPDEDTAYGLTMLGDLVSNGLYYSFVSTGRGVWLRGVALGLAAGVGGVVLPGPMGLGEAPSNRTPQTKAMTVAWYLIGGLATAGVSWAWSKAQE
ncbi:hypothetical protein HMJ29_09225 [Hymenobacter taeanensis]|uniref:DUF1440 domain-containing protein n=1 Tax=Hymenobacter taeanensis TaxID=2735321 RepID=A0A6M6BJ58_9BACT|nr:MULTISPECIES: hypothetical protein [Hymenobacter]QJX47105.1 hypothetical protein HMJ29_09225 [Hymenobacter taeanensis]UOQ81019.1 hypothetical protein MUN83_19770 [Hymenobacter sp. 5414T-23]